MVGSMMSTGHPMPPVWESKHFLMKGEKWVRENDILRWWIGDGGKPYIHCLICKKTFHGNIDETFDDVFRRHNAYAY